MPEYAHPLTLIRRRKVEELTGLSRSMIYAKADAGTFPRSVKIGAYAVAWRLSDVEAWLADPAGYKVAE